MCIRIENAQVQRKFDLEDIIGCQLIFYIDMITRAGDLHRDRISGNNY